ncbi:MAG: Cys-tRNA(Pro) deacylase [Eubacteriales bacterium]|jgi:Cys-tRNA(Pro)/Cys-tRNA(Cys) deacylase
MAKEAKTNAMRILDKKGIEYEVLRFECSDFTDGVSMAEAEGAPVDQTFKTIVTKGKSGAYHVLVIPVAEEIDLKAAAAASDEKSLEMVHVKDLFGLTGYVRGGCSPIGMKKQFPTILDSSAEKFNEIYISGGRIGLSLKMAPADILAVTRGKYGDITRKG